MAEEKNHRVGSLEAGGVAMTTRERGSDVVMMEAELRDRDGVEVKQAKVMKGESGQFGEVYFGASPAAIGASDGSEVGGNVTVTFPAFQRYQYGTLVLPESPCGRVSSGARNLTMTVQRQFRRTCFEDHSED